MKLIKTGRPSATAKKEPIKEMMGVSDDYAMDDAYEPEVNELPNDASVPEVEEVNADFETGEDDQMSPDNENDAFLFNNGWQVTVRFAGEPLGTFTSENEALNALSQAMDEDGFYPNIWYVSDHGNLWPIDINGNEIK